MNVPPVSWPEVELAGPGGLDQRLGPGPDLAEAEGVGVVEDGDHQAAFEGHGDPDVDLGVLDDRLGLEGGVDAGVAAEGQGDGLGHEVAHRELDLLGGELLVEPLADRDDLVNPDVDRDVDLGGGLLGLDHPAGDRLPHRRVRDPPGRGRGGRGPGRAAAAGRRPGRRPPAGREARKASTSRRITRPPGPVGATWPRSTLAAAAIFRASGLDLIRPPLVDLGRRGRRGAPGRWRPRAGSGCWSSRGRGRPTPWASCFGLGLGLGGAGLGGGRRGGLAAPAAEAAMALGSSPLAARIRTFWPTGTSSPTCGAEDGDDPLVERLQRHHRLVGLDVGQGVAFLDLVADLDPPLDDLTARHRGADRAHGHFDRHEAILPAKRSGSSRGEPRSRGGPPRRRRISAARAVRRVRRQSLLYITSRTWATTRSTLGSIEASRARL